MSSFCLLIFTKYHMRLFSCSLCGYYSPLFAQNSLLKSAYATQTTKVSDSSCEISKSMLKAVNQPIKSTEKRGEESLKNMMKQRNKVYTCDARKGQHIFAQSVQKSKIPPLKFSKSRSSFLDRRIDEIVAFGAKSEFPKPSIVSPATQMRMCTKIEEQEHDVTSTTHAINDEDRILEVTRLCSQALDRALHLHVQKGKPHLALAAYRDARQKLIQEKCISCDAISDAFIRIDINYAKCIEDCYGHLTGSQINCLYTSKDTHPTICSHIELQKDKVKNLRRAVRLYSEAIEQLTDRGKGIQSVRLRLRLAECYEKIGLLNKSKDIIKACEAFIPSASNDQYDVGVSPFSGWNLPLFYIFEAYYCKGFDQCVTVLQAHIEDPADLSRETIFYANIFFSRRSLLQNRRLRQVASTYENSLKIRPKDFSLNLEFAHFLQFIQNNPNSSIERYVQSITIMRKSLDWPGIKKWVLPQALHNLANAHIAIGQPEEAHPLLFEAKALYCKEKSNEARLYKVRLMLAKALEDCGDIEQSLQIYTKILNFVTQNERCTTILQIDILNQQSLLNASEVYCRFAVFLKSINRTAEAEQLFIKAILHKGTNLVTKIECLYSYSDLLRAAGDISRANLMDDHLFAIVMENHGGVIRLPWKTWKGRIRQLELSKRHALILETFYFLVNTEKCIFNATEYNDVLRRYAEYLQIQGMYSEASNIYTKCIESDTLNVYFHVQKAWCCAKLSSSSDDAKKYFQIAINLYEGSKEKGQWDGCFCYGEFGVFLHENSYYTEAEEVYLKAIQSVNSTQSTNFAQVCANLGILYHNQGKATDSEKYFLEVFDSRPARYIPWLLCLDTYIAAHRKNKSLKIAKRMMHLFPDQHSTIFLRLGKIFEMKNPQNPARAAYAFYMAMKVDTVSAKKEITESSLETIYQSTKNVHALAEFAAILNYKMHLYQDAEICYKILRQRLPNDVSIVLNYGKLAFDRLDKPLVARCEFECALRLDHGNILAYEYLAEYYALIESDNDAAIDCYLQALHNVNGTNYVVACYRLAHFLRNYQINSVKDLKLFDNIRDRFPKNDQALIAQAIYLQLSLDDRHKNIAKIKFVLLNKQSESTSASGFSIKSFLTKKQLQWRSKECNLRINKIARAIYKAVKGDVCPDTMDVSDSLHRRDSTLYKKTRQSIIDSMLHWKIKDFLTDPVHHFVRQLENTDVEKQLKVEQQACWNELLEIENIFKEAISLAPHNVDYLQQYGNFLATWMTNLPEAGKMYLKAIYLKPFDIELLRVAGSFFYQHGSEHNINAFLETAKNIFDEILQSPGHTTEDILQYTNFLKTSQDDRKLNDSFAHLGSVVDNESLEGENLASILQLQHETELKDGFYPKKG